MATKSAKKPTGPVIPEEAYETREWAYAGQFYDGKQLHSRFYPIEAGGKLGERKLYRKDLLPAAPVGGVYAFQVAVYDGGEWVLTGGDKRPKYVQMYEDDELKVKWRLEHHSALNLDRLNREEKKSQSEDALKNALAPVREILSRQRGQNRSAMLAVIIDYLTR